ncbi:DUF2703 domain-containing protein [Salicibibacter cibarius]|uniref:DUF2703 domain-containing protein n=1 Tax=Salicibibacter cibarius TaxID=2743000 RepID=A0A7T6Z4N2_9BACI|nr:DUF2703 domain-containing protein [Salicibibacter cibarius]QQK76286.1 DUF2703 domain-containing protein [Salicibibacter cibarius]
MDNHESSHNQLIIDFMYIDLEVCSRCKGTESNLDKAINEVTPVLNTVGYNVKVNRVLVDSEEHANTLQFNLSPTIRINGVDIQQVSKESNCGSCNTITGIDVDCRVWMYKGEEYTEAPKGLIMDAMLTEVYGQSPVLNEGKKDNFVLSGNLKNFFDQKEKQSSKDNNACCSSDQCC